MPEPNDLKQLVQLLAPGFVILGIRQWFLVGTPPALAERALTYAAVSAAYFAIASPTVTLVCNSLNLNDFTRDCWAYFWLPVLLGVGYSWFAEQDLPNRAWRVLGLAPVHRIAGAWDFAFRRAPVTFIMVTLTDGTQHPGLYGEGSFASSASDKRDLLISRVYTLDSAGAWTEANPPKSILLCGGDIQAIEFFGG